MTPLRQRMIDAMVLRGFRPRTQESYLRVIAQMARHYHRTPELITDQEAQAYLLHLVRERHLARSSVNQASSAVRFLVCEVLGQNERRLRIPMGHTPQRLPEVLSRAEVAAVLDAPMSAPQRPHGLRPPAGGCAALGGPPRVARLPLAGAALHDRSALVPLGLSPGWTPCPRPLRVRPALRAGLPGVAALRVTGGASPPIALLGAGAGGGGRGGGECGDGRRGGGRDGLRAAAALFFRVAPGAHVRLGGEFGQGGAGGGRSGGGCRWADSAALRGHVVFGLGLEAALARGGVQ